MGAIYKFKQVSASDYTMQLLYVTDSKLLFNLFKKTVGKLKIPGLENVDPLIESWSVPDNVKSHYFPIVKHSIRRDYKEIRNTIKKDGITILSNEIDSVLFKKVSDEEYNVIIETSGLMAR